MKTVKDQHAVTTEKLPMLRLSFAKLLANIENAPLPNVAFVVLFFALVFVRTFCEMVFGSGLLLSFDECVLHYTLFYVSYGATLYAILRLFSAQEHTAILRAVCCGFGLVVLPPLLDVLVFGFGGFAPKYIPLDGRTIGEVFLMFLTFYGKSAAQHGATLGMRVEIFLALVLIFFYIRAKGRKVLTALGAVLTAYIALFCYAVAPFFKSLLVLCGQNVGFELLDGVSFATFWALVVFAQMTMFTLFFEKTTVRWRMPIFYMLAFCVFFGYLILRNAIPLALVNPFTFLAACCAIFAATAKFDINVFSWACAGLAIVLAASIDERAVFLGMAIISLQQVQFFFLRDGHVPKFLKIACACINLSFCAAFAAIALGYQPSAFFN